jgi:hypothetical protein
MAIYCASRRLLLRAATLSRIGGRAMVAGADPSALVSPDHTLLLCSDAAVMLKRQHAQLEDRWRVLPIGSPEHDRVQKEWRWAGVAPKRLLPLPCRLPRGRLWHRRAELPIHPVKGARRRFVAVRRLHRLAAHRAS